MAEAVHAAIDPAAAVGRALGWLTPENLRVGEVVQRLEGDAQVHLVAMGKACAGMLAGALEVLAPHPERLGQLLSMGPLALEPLTAGHRHIVGGHPLPDAGSLEAGRAAIDLAMRAAPGDVIVALVSGGSSASVVAPWPGVELETLRAANETWLRRPIEIETLNAARAQLDGLRFGGLLRAAGPTRCAALIISDVPGDALHVVGGGPTLVHEVDPESLRDALMSAGGWDPLSPEARAALSMRRERGVGKRRGFDMLVASNKDARRALLRVAAEAGWAGVDLGGGLGGTSEAALRALEAELDRPELEAFAPRPRLLAWGGETVVERDREGRGGRNLHFAASALEVCRARGLWIWCFATDGADGNSGCAGTVVAPSTAERAQGLGLDAAAHLREFTTADFFEALGDAWRPGPTGSNVCDLVVVLQA